MAKNTQKSVSEKNSKNEILWLSNKRINKHELSYVLIGQTIIPYLVWVLLE